MTTQQIKAAARAMDDLGVDVASTEELASAAIEKLREGAERPLAMLLLCSPRAFDHTFVNNIINAVLGEAGES